MNIKCLTLGPLKTNCYIIEVDQGTIIIDPAYNADLIQKEIGNKKILTILITHYHFDHIGALKELETYYHVKAQDFKKIKNMIVIPTKGHSLDSLTFYFPQEKIMFCGDFLFKNTFGRTDLPGGNNKQMLDSLEKISKYPLDTVLYPGHGEKTTLSLELSNFPEYKDYLLK